MSASLPPEQPEAPRPDESAPIRTFEYGFAERRLAGPLRLAVAALLGGLVAGGAVAAAFLVFGPGQDGANADQQTAASIAAILALSGDSQSSFDQFLGATPSALPPGLPSYPGARLVVSYRLSFGDTDTYLLVSRADEAEEAVVSYFLEALDEDPWQVTGGSATPDLVAVQFSSVEDPDLQGAVNVRRPERGATAILTVVQAPHEAAGEEPALGRSRALPSDFPSEVPAYPDAVITDAAFLKQPGSVRFFTSALSRDDADEVLDFYRSAFEEQGWAVDDASASGEATISFSDPDDRFGGAVTASDDATHEGYTRIDVVVDRSSRADSDGGAP